LLHDVVPSLCRVVDYAEWALGPPALRGFAGNRLGIVLRFPAASNTGENIMAPSSDVAVVHGL